jgi:PilZ domain
MAADRRAPQLLGQAGRRKLTPAVLAAAAEAATDPRSAALALRAAAVSIFESAGMNESEIAEHLVLADQSIATLQAGEATDAAGAVIRWGQGAENVGRYIPYTGGNIGWFENKGVLKAENPNNYRYYSALDTPLVKATLLERTGQRADKRSARRQNPVPPPKVLLLMGKKPTEATCKNISPIGVRIQVVESKVDFKADETLRIRLGDAKGTSGSFDIECVIKWAERAGTLRTVWDLGLEFPELTAAQASKIQDLGGAQPEAQAS